MNLIFLDAVVGPLSFEITGWTAIGVSSIVLVIAACAIACLNKKEKEKYKSFSENSQRLYGPPRQGVKENKNMSQFLYRPPRG